MKFFKKDYIQYIPLVLLALAILLSPSFPVGEFEVSGGRMKTIELRVEDFVMLFLAMAWLFGIFVSKKRKAEKPPLFLPVLFWVALGIVSTVLGILLGKLNLSRGFFYFFKEIQYFFLYFYFFYHLRRIRFAKSLVKILMLLGAANVLYILYQQFTGRVAGDLYYLFSGLKPPINNYGASALCEVGALPKGIFFLLLFIFFFNGFLYYFSKLDISRVSKSFFFLGAIAPGYGVLASGSRVSFLGFLFAVFLSLFLLFLKSRNVKQFLMVVLLFAFLIGIFILIPDPFLGSGRIVETFSSPSFFVSEIERSRINTAIVPTFKRVMEEKNLLLPLLGFGKGYIEEGHNQYLLYFAWTGVMGLFVFFWIILEILKRGFRAFLRGRDGFLVGISAGLFVATLSMLLCSLGSDPFMVVKSAELYWMFAGIAMAVIVIKKKSLQA